jgi:hypothetical protein
VNEHVFRTAYGEYADLNSRYCQACQRWLDQQQQDQPCRGIVDAPCHVCGGDVNAQAHPATGG